MKNPQLHIFQLSKSILCSAVAALLLAGCAADDPNPGEVIADPSTSVATATETAEAEIRISLGTDWNIDLSGDQSGNHADDSTRAMPPGIDNNKDDNTPVDGSEELKEIDRVRILTFRRLDPDAADPEEHDPSILASAAYLYDSTNDTIVEAVGTSDRPSDDIFPSIGSHNAHKIASAKITKIKGYEYRVIAIAYSSDKPSSFSSSTLHPEAWKLAEEDEQRFSLNLNDNTSIEDFEATVLDYQISNRVSHYDWRDFFYAPTQSNTNQLGDRFVETPQFFYGHCLTNVGDVKSETIKFSEADENGKITKHLLYCRSQPRQRWSLNRDDSGRNLHQDIGRHALLGRDIRPGRNYRDVAPRDKLAGDNPPDRPGSPDDQRTHGIIKPSGHLQDSCPLTGISDTILKKGYVLQHTVPRNRMLFFFVKGLYVVFNI